MESRMKFHALNGGGMVNVTDIHSLTEFQRHAKSFIEKLQASKSPLVLTVNGQPAVVVQDAETYQALLERLREMEDLAAIREGLAQAEAGDVRPAGEALAELQAKQGLWSARCRGRWRYGHKAALTRVSLPLYN